MSTTFLSEVELRTKRRKWGVEERTVVVVGNVSLNIEVSVTNKKTW